MGNGDEEMSSITSSKAWKVGFNTGAKSVLNDLLNLEVCARYAGGQLKEYAIGFSEIEKLKKKYGVKP